MTNDFDTFLVALYTHVDDLYREHFAPVKPRRRGAAPDLSDSEVLTLAILAQYHGSRERDFIRYAARHLRAYFPRLLSQSQTNRRARDLSGVMVRMVGLLAQELGGEGSAYQVLDGLPVPLMRRCRGRRGRLFGPEASFGKAGSDRDFYYGVGLLICTSREGVITGFLAGPGGTNERWLAEALLAWRSDPGGEPWTREELPASNKRTGADYQGPSGPLWPREGVGAGSPGPYIADGGFAGALWTGHWRADYQAEVLTPGDYPRGGRARAVHRAWRHVVETVNSHLTCSLHLHYPGARSLWGLRARLAAKLAAFNMGIWLNRLFGRPDFAIATIFDW